MDRIHDHVVSRFGKAARIHRGRSADILPNFPDGYFDWIYIDGDHSYEAVVQDLELSRTKVRKGGMIAGDDFTWRPKEGYPVKRAVEKFIAKYSLPLKLYSSQFLIRI